MIQKKRNCGKTTIVQYACFKTTEVLIQQMIAKDVFK